MMKLGTLVWTAKDVGEVRFSKDFEASDGILKLDALKDWIWDLQQRYEIEHRKTFPQCEETH